MNEGFTCECLTDTIIIKFVIVIGVTFSDPPHNTSTWCICGHRRLPFLLGLVTRQPPLTTGRLLPGGIKMIKMTKIVAMIMMTMINAMLHTSSVLGGLVSPGTIPGRIEQSPRAWVRGHWYNEPALVIIKC